jgi:hypothetical protein
MHAEEQTQRPLRMPCGVTDSSQERWLLSIGLVQWGAVSVPCGTCVCYRPCKAPLPWSSAVVWLVQRKPLRTGWNVPVRCQSVLALTGRSAECAERRTGKLAQQKEEQGERQETERVQPSVVTAAPLRAACSAGDARRAEPRRRTRQRNRANEARHWRETAHEARS